MCMCTGRRGLLSTLQRKGVSAVTHLALAKGQKQLFEVTAVLGLGGWGRDKDLLH